jgi:hypothetical protein
MSRETLLKKMTEFQKFCETLNSLQQQAMEMELYVTARALNAAVVAAGWELDGDPEMALEEARPRLG